jgi:hydroxymethylpyrimidine/phosphomethylpyrimidine kinase
MRGRVLVVAGSDSGGGAGIQADINAMTAITAVTAQNTLGVQGVHPVPPAFVALQMRCVLEDIGAEAIKTGMLGDVATIDALCEVLEGPGRGIPLIVDPVMVAKGGHSLLADAAVARLTRRLLPRAADALLALGVPAVLVKGGHLPGDEVVDLLATADGVERFHAPRIVTRHTHGTGCTLASATAAGLAQGMTVSAAVQRARRYVLSAIAAAPGWGHGHGPLDHSVAA